MGHEDLKDYLAPTAIIDSDHPLVVAHAQAVSADSGDSPRERAVALYYAVRDGIWYDPYLPFYRPAHYRASHVLQAGRAFCIGKAGLLCALGRACGIPTRVGFADVRNHLSTRQLIEFLGSDVFVYHGYTEFFLADRWIKATPAFNSELCRRHNVSALEFNGRDDSVFQPFSRDNRRFMEYLRDHGSFADVPVERIVAAMKAVYGADRVQGWITAYESTGGTSGRDFSSEEVIKN
jgi:transglutaminase-like putative cysteine protease